MPAKGTKSAMRLVLLAVLLALELAAHGQSGTQRQTPPPSSAQPAQEMPDAPSTVHPPTPKQQPGSSRSADPEQQGTEPWPGAKPPSEQPQPDRNAPTPPTPPVETVPPGSVADPT